jgi:enterochelin esterase-like enzyme
MPMKRALVVLVCCAVAACVALISAVRSGAHDAASSQSQLVEQTAASRAVGGTLNYAVYLPAGYASNTRRRYPVIYALHGLPADSSSYHSLTFLAPVLDSLHAQAIVVFPQGASDTDADDEYLDLGTDRNWETAITRDLPADVARRYRVLSGRAATGIIGVSAGGYGAAVIGLHHLDTYSVVESWSGYFHATNADGTAPMSLTGSTAAFANLHTYVGTLSRRVRSQKTLIAFYTGAADPYPGFVAENRQFSRELASASVPHRFAVYAGGHDNTLWLAHANDWLAQALKALTPSR